MRRESGSKTKDLERRILELQQRLNDIRVISLAYTANGQLLSVTASKAATSADLQALRRVLRMMLERTDILWEQMVKAEMGGEEDDEE